MWLCKHFIVNTYSIIWCILYRYLKLVFNDGNKHLQSDESRIASHGEVVKPVPFLKKDKKGAKNDSPYSSTVVYARDETFRITQYSFVFFPNTFTVLSRTGHDIKPKLIKAVSLS